MTLYWVGIEDAEDLGLFLMGQLLPFENFYAADCSVTGGEIFVIRNGDVVFQFDADKLWLYWCRRQALHNSEFVRKDANYCHWCELVERFVRYCIHRGASSWQPVPPSSLPQQGASEGMAPLAYSGAGSRSDMKFDYLMGWRNGRSGP